MVTAKMKRLLLNTNKQTPLVVVCPGTSEVGGWAGHGQPDQCLWIHGVLGKDQGRCEGGVRDGHQGRATSQAGQEEH